MAPEDQSLLWQTEKVFVGRERECRVVQTWLSRNAAPTQLLGVTGIGGIGKTSLLMKFLQMAQEADSYTAWLDGRAIDHTPQGFVSALPAFWQVPQFGLSLGGHHAVLAVDNYEEAYGLDTWLREVYLPTFPSENVLVILGSRHSFLQRWRVDAGWRKRVIELELLPMTIHDVRAWQQLSQSPDKAALPAESLYQRTLGLPLALALCLDFPAAELSEQLPAIWDDLEENSPYRPAIDVLALMAFANWDQLQRILGYPLSTLDYSALARISFVRRTPAGLSLHDLVRHYWYDHLHRQHPEYFARVRDKILRVLIRISRSTDRQAPQFMAQQFFWLYQDILGREVGYANLGAMPSGVEITPYRSTDRDSLHALLERWRHESFPVSEDQAHQFVDEVLLQFPELIRVVRHHDSGRALAFTGSIWLTEKTVELMQRYHPAFIQDILERTTIGPEELREQNTTYHLFICIDTDQSDYTRDELMGLAMRDAFDLVAGQRILLVASSPPLQKFLVTFGFTAMDFPAWPGSPPSRLYELDLRHMPFARWILQVLSGLSDSAFLRRTEVTETLVKEACEHLMHPVSSPAAAMEPRDAEEFHELQLTLADVFSGPAISPMTPDDTLLLRRLYIEGQTDVAGNCAHFSWSRASYYRHVRSALMHATDVMQKIF